MGAAVWICAAAVGFRTCVPGCGRAAMDVQSAALNDSSVARTQHRCRATNPWASGSQWRRRRPPPRPSLVPLQHSLSLPLPSPVRTHTHCIRPFPPSLGQKRTSRDRQAAREQRSAVKRALGPDRLTVQYSASRGGLRSVACRLDATTLDVRAWAASRAATANPSPLVAHLELYRAAPVRCELSWPYA